MSHTNSQDRTADKAGTLIPLESAQGPAEQKCLLRTSVEVVFALRELKQHRALVALYFDGGERHLVTTVLHVDAKRGRLVLRPSPDAELNTRVMGAGKLTFVSALNDVKIQFECSDIAQTQFDDAPAFEMPVPTTLLRVQRREYFRIPTPPANPPRCIFPFEDDKGEHSAEVPVLDISCGGVGVADQHYAFHLKPGTILENCRIAFPDVGELLVTLRVVNKFAVVLHDGLTCIRAGCEFVDMPEYKVSIVQRYVLERERERNAKALRAR